MNYEEYEKAVEKITKVNEQYLILFQEYLLEKDLKDKTIRNHLNNVGFYINDYLNYYDPQEMVRGCYDISGFLGDWFIRKAMWSSRESIKSTAASIKKFYKCMLEKGHVSKADYQYLLETIKKQMPDWLENMDGYYVRF